MVQTLPASLDTLRSHSVFIPPSPPQSGEEDDWQIVSGLDDELDNDDEDDLQAPQKISRLVMRDKDLILAFGKEVRMANVGGESWDILDGKVGGYKVLKSDKLTFDIKQLVLSHTGKLLAVVGRKQVVVLALPRPGSLGSTTGTLSVQAIAIDPTVLSSSSAADITKVVFHPLGAGGNSLWILTSEGKLREYDIQQPQDPTQTFNIFTSAASSSRFSAVDPLARLATSFAFAPPTGSGMSALDVLTIHVLAANGDVYVLAPVMPLRSALPSSTLQHLKALADRQAASSSTRDPQLALRSAFIDNLVRQAGSARSGRGATPSGTPGRSDALSNAFGSSDELVYLHPPHLTEAGGPAPGVHRQVSRQGPMALDPPPAEADEEDMASDIHVFRAEEGEGKEKEGESFIGIAWTSGRVDLGIEVERPRMRWASAREPTSPPPTLSIVESIPLPRANSSASGPSIVADTLHPDTIYILGSSELSSISVAPLLRDLLGYDDVGASEIARLASSSTADPLIGAASFCELALGYGVAALGQSGKIAAAELDFRVSAPRIASSSSTTTSALTKESSSTSKKIEEPVSLLAAKQFDLDSHLAAIRRAVPSARNLLAKEADRSKPLQTVSPATLKLLGEITSQLHSAAHAIRTATQAVETRLDLQLQELSRQISALKTSRADIGNLRPKDAVSRMAAVVKRQKELDRQVNTVLSKLSAEYKPPVSDEERRWFDEIEKLRTRVQGVETDRNKGLTARSEAVKDQLRSLRSGAPLGLAGNQGPKLAAPLESALGARSEEIKQLMRKVDNLNLRIDEFADDIDSEDEDY